jgi:hypothetical protein
LEVFAIENHKLYFDIAKILNVVLGFSLTKHVITLKFGFMFSTVQRNTNFYNEFYVDLLCEFFVVLDYDEMNWNIVSRIIF